MLFPPKLLSQCLIYKPTRVHVGAKFVERSTKIYRIDGSVKPALEIRMSINHVKPRLDQMSLLYNTNCWSQIISIC